MKAERVDVAVVGGGHNGLVAAAYCARAGLRTLVLERREIVGGAAVSEPVWPGYMVSTAAYVCSLLDPQIVAELDLHSYGYHAYAKDPSSFTPLPDGRSLLLGRNADENAREIARFDPRDVPGHAAFEAEAARLGSLVADRFADDEPDFERLPADARTVLRGPAAALVERFVRTPVLAATLATDGIIGTNAGPRDAGTAYVLAHHWAGRALGVQGAWGFVRGGMGSISRALALAARASGCEIRTGAEVCAIEPGDRDARVVTTDGAEVRALYVLSNADPKRTFGIVEGPIPPAIAERLGRWRTNGPSFKLNLALGELPNFTARPGTTVQPHHRATIHVAPSIEYLQNACDEARTIGASRAPMLECFLQTPTDPSLAPPGKHILSVFAQYYPYDRADGAWSDAKREAAADAIVTTLAHFAPNLPNVIEARQALAPPDLEARFGLTGGHIFHGELLPGQIFEDRFPLRTGIGRLYLCGSATHPGGCVSGFPGRRAAAAVLSDLERNGSTAERQSVNAKSK